MNFKSIFTRHQPKPKLKPELKQHNFIFVEIAYAKRI